MSLLFVAAAEAQAQQQQQPAVGASAQLRDASGRVLAVATMREAPTEVLINLTFPDRLALIGTHALHIHQVGRCDPPGFLSAGAIFNPTNRQHGLRNSDGPMPGDLPNLVIGPAGVGAYNLSAPLVTIRPGPATLLRPQGTSLVIFDQPDDDRTQPEGNAGARIACGAIVAGPTDTVTSSAPDRASAVLIAVMGTLLIVGGVTLRR